MNQETFLARYNNLNPAQKEAVDTIDGPVLVIAGPGSGKTELLGLRVANILRSTDTLASSILCLTFTESAAINMRQRLLGLIGQEAYKVAIHTFHNFGAEVINSNPEYFYFGSYQPADDLARIAILDKIFRSLPSSDPLSTFHPELGFVYLKSVQSRIRDLKQGGISPDDFATILDHNQSFLTACNPIILEFFAEKITKKQLQKLPQILEKIQAIPVSQSANLPSLYIPLQEIFLSSLADAYLEAQSLDKTTPITAWKKRFLILDEQKQAIIKDLRDLQKNYSLLSIYRSYAQELDTQGLYDFEDMLLQVDICFKKHPEVLYNYQERFLYILVDEFQDTNGVQMDLINHLTSSGDPYLSPNILAVGDDDQAVFKFQGANLHNVIQFQKKFPSIKIITLTQNYRSNQEILDLAKSVINQSSTRLSRSFGLDKTLVSVKKQT